MINTSTMAAEWTTERRSPVSMSHVRRTIIACLSSLVFIGCSVWFVNKYFGIEARSLAERLWPPPTIEQVERRHLRKIAGWLSLDCGHVHRHKNADAAISCATSALSARKPFYVSFE